MKTDLRLKDDILDELDFEPSIDETDIGVIVKNGIVTLTGHVSSYSQKKAAEKAVLRVEGVKAVAEEIEVNFPSSIQKTDAEIAEAAVNALKWNAIVPSKNVKVKVENGIVFLDGKLDWQYQKTSAKDAISPLLGVKSVVNKIKIDLQSPIKTSQVKTQIKKALERAARIDANHITVEAKDHQVVLKGEVSSWAEKEQAFRAAYKAPGVWSVKNQITVKPYS